MFYNRELQFLCDVLKKCHIQFSFAAPQDPLGRVIDPTLFPILGNLGLENITVSGFFGNIEPKTVYKNSDPFHFCYLYFLLPGQSADTVFTVGPYTHTPLSRAALLEVCEQKQISVKKQKLMNEFYQSIPVVPQNSHLFMMLESFYERLWGVDFTVVDTEQELTALISPMDKEDENSPNSTLVNINLMEKRYDYENELMAAVTQGQVHKADLLLSGMNELSFEQRAADPLRNMKNYCIIMNTLFRKAAENGGVRPIYLDKVSSAFAIQIEQAAKLSNIPTLMREIFRSYCRLVRKHSMKEYSPIVQNTIIFIESDLSANLTLNTLAQIQNVSGGYLSTIFKKETGQTVTAYIREQRMKHAARLLTTTHLQIQTVALHCGIMDVQYFSKLFKKHTGQAPTEYREAKKHKNGL